MINTEEEITPNGLASISNAAYKAQKIYAGKSFEKVTRKNSGSFEEAMKKLDEIAELRRQKC